ncbi:hypothetical protein GJ496_004589 [Pomphorhynchus laevis]|nr:hypothetical protein GJ496_004589 [Pomphorhynchus laevis]
MPVVVENFDVLPFRIYTFQSRLSQSTSGLDVFDQTLCIIDVRRAYILEISDATNSSWIEFTSEIPRKYTPQIMVSVNWAFVAENLIIIVERGKLLGIGFFEAVFI